MVYGTHTKWSPSNEPDYFAEPHHEASQLHLHIALLLHHAWMGYVLCVYVHQKETLPNFHLQSSLFHSYVISADMYLDVVLRVGARTTALLSISKHTSSRWVFCEVTVGRVPRDFNILFEASREFDHGEYFAIDDIDFSNCSLPGKPCAQCEAF